MTLNITIIDPEDYPARDTSGNTPKPAKEGIYKKQRPAKSKVTPELAKVIFSGNCAKNDKGVLVNS